MLDGGNNGNIGRKTAQESHKCLQNGYTHYWRMSTAMVKVEHPGGGNTAADARRGCWACEMLSGSLGKGMERAQGLLRCVIL